MATDAPKPEDADAFLPDSWNLYQHHIDESDWTHASYTRLSRLGVCTVRDFWDLLSCVADVAARSMLFFMRGDVFPAWDDAQNLQGSTLSWKLTDEATAADLFVRTCTALASGSLLDDAATEAEEGGEEAVLGVSTSPKFNSFTVKLWLAPDVPPRTMAALQALVPGHTCRVARNRDIIIRSQAAGAGRPARDK